MSKIEIASIESELKSLVLWHFSNKAVISGPDDESKEQAWSRGFNAGYESGRLALIEDLLGKIEILKLREEVDQQ